MYVRGAPARKLRSADPCKTSATRAPSLLVLLDQVCQVALATIVPVEVHRHEDSGPAELRGALPAQSRDLVVGVDLVELEHCELHLLALVLDLLGLRVCLLLPLLATALELRVHEQGRLVLDAALTQEVAVLQASAPEEHALLAGDAQGGLQGGHIGRPLCGHGQGTAIEAAHKELHVPSSTGMRPGMAEPPAGPAAAAPERAGDGA
mmetsp:Transcript_109581/g.353599  ORF Transcript_109581/g.353599 Transcript_109581/m.353599 type:complete len:207 (-) Transcript_109581:2-622(-)